MAMPREEVVERDVQAEETEAYAASQWQLMWWKFASTTWRWLRVWLLSRFMWWRWFCEFWRLIRSIIGRLPMPLLRLSGCNLVG